MSRRWLLRDRRAAEDGLGELWREEAAELADALELGDLLGDALLERRVPLADLAASCSARSCNSLMRSIERTRATSAPWSIGFIRYSSAPASSRQ
jgi:hypothetical protein